MTAIQLDRLRQDSIELNDYAQKLKQRGAMERMTKILEKKAYLDRRIAAIV